MFQSGFDFRGLSFGALLAYNLVLLAGFIYFIFKYRGKSIPLFIILLFFGGMISDLGGKTIFNIYKLLVVFFAVVLCLNHFPKPFDKKVRFIAFAFILFSLYFIVNSIFIHQDPILLVFSQYSKYLTPFCLLLVFIYLSKSNQILISLNSLFTQLIIIQILFNIAKLIIFKAPFEGLVGSLSGIWGGGAGTSFPLLCLCLLSLNTDMKLSARSVLLMACFMFIGFMTGKRAIWLLFPILFFLLYIFIPYRKTSTKLFGRVALSLVICSLFLYLGLRLDPTLNPDNKIWGRFDPAYALSYGLDYSAGVQSTSEKVENGQGRVGAVLLMFNEIKDINEKERVSIGVGNKYMVYASHDDYFNSDYYFGVTYRGGITGIVMMYFTIGIFGVVFFLLYLFSLFHYINYAPFRIILLLVVLFDFVFYNAQIISDTALAVLFMFEILFSNMRYSNKFSINSIKIDNHDERSNCIN